MQFKWMTAVAIGILSVGGLVYGVQASDQSKVNTAKPSKTASTFDSLINPEQAKKIALQQVKNKKAKIDDMSLENLEKKPYYDIEMDQNQEDDDDIHVDAVTGKIIPEAEDDGNDQADDRNDDQAEDQNDDQTKAGKKHITPQQAEAIAKKKVKGTVQETDLDDDDQIYEIELQTPKGETEVDISAKNGKILHVEQEG